MEKVLVIVGAGMFFALIAALFIGTRVWASRQRALDAEAIANTAENKQRAEEAQQEETRQHLTIISEDDEKVWERTDREFEAKWGAFLKESPLEWAREKLLEDFRDIHDIYDRYEYDRMAVYDKYSCVIGGYESATELRVNILLEENDGDHRAVSVAIDKQYDDHVSNTYRWTETDQLLLEAMLEDESKEKQH